jgi:excisionase family DNA binding protein
MRISKPESETVSTGEAAKILGVHRTRVYKLIRTGALQAFTLPAAYRRAGVKRYVLRSAVEAIRQQREALGHKPKPGRPKKVAMVEVPSTAAVDVPSAKASAEEGPRDLTADDLHPGSVIRDRATGAVYQLVMRPGDQGRAVGHWRGKVLQGDQAGTIAPNSVVILPPDQKIVSDYELLPETR